MFTKTIKFQNFNGEDVEKVYYFHMSKAELLDMAANGNEFVARIKRIIAAEDGQAILREFREMIKMSVGMRSADGERFVKDADAQSNLLDSPAFDELLMELATDANAATQFVNQLIPEKMQKEMQKKLQDVATRPDGSIPDPFKQPSEDNRPAWEREHRNPTEAELAEMSTEELRAAILRKQGL